MTSVENIQPSAYTFQLLMKAHIVNNSLDDVQTLLSTAKELGINPTYETFAMLVRKCVRIENEQLKQQALQWMNAAGHLPDENLLEYMATKRVMPPAHLQFLMAGGQWKQNK